jgi:hypothetical protein
MSTQYRIPVEETFSFQRPVLDKDLTTAPAGVKGERYIVAANGGGWSGGAAKDIAWYDGAAWKFDTPAAGWLTWVVDEAKFYIFKAGAWVEEEAGQGDMLKSVYDTDDDGIVDKAETVDDGTSGNSSTATEVRDACDKAHTQGTDLGLDTGGTNPVTAAQAKLAYDSRGTYDVDLGAILMTL